MSATKPPNMPAQNAAGFSFSSQKDPLSLQNNEPYRQYAQQVLECHDLDYDGRLDANELANAFRATITNGARCAPKKPSSSILSPHDMKTLSVWFKNRNFTLDLLYSK